MQQPCGFMETCVLTWSAKAHPLVRSNMIAAHALSLQALLVTNNTREFAVVPGLRLDNWVTAA